MENDFDGFNQYRKDKRNKWEKIFIDQYLDKLKEKYKIEIVSNNGYKIYRDSGDIKFYPKSQSILFTKDNHWLKKYGLKWIKDNML